MDRLRIFTIMIVFTSVYGFASVPDRSRFVQGDKTVAWLRQGDNFLVTLEQQNKQQVLLSGAKCQELASGYHCFIKPVRKPGLLTTDVNFIRTSTEHFKISTIVLINGSYTGTHKIGDDFVHLSLSKYFVKQ